MPITRQVDGKTRQTILIEFWRALRDAFEARKRNAEGDYSPDPKSERFPEWQASPRERSATPKAKGRQSLTGLVEDWWQEAQSAGLSVSTYESYRNTMRRFVAFLGYDDTSRVTVDDVLRLKDSRLKEVNPRTGKPVSAKTIKDNDLAGRTGGAALPPPRDLALT